MGSAGHCYMLLLLASVSGVSEASIAIIINTVYSVLDNKNNIFNNYCYNPTSRLHGNTASIGFNTQTILARWIEDARQVSRTVTTRLFFPAHFSVRAVVASTARVSALVAMKMAPPSRCL